MLDPSEGLLWREGVVEAAGTSFLGGFDLYLHLL